MADMQEHVEKMMRRASEAAAVFEQLDQEQTDRIVRAVYRAGFDARIRLAKMAVEETGMGIWEDKVVKNVLATQLVYDDIRHERTVGVISRDQWTGVYEIAQPLGPVLAICPVTNPTSTVMFKILICMKTRNPVIVSGHRRALNCCIEAARICYEAALAQEAPIDCIQWITEPSREQTRALMTHPQMALILATGGPGLVKAAYSSGTPAIGVGAGNVPVFIEASADISFAVSQIMASKTFDNGTICASEQAVVVERASEPAVVAEFERQGAVFLDDEQAAKLTAVAFDPERGGMSAAVVGQPATKVAELAGIEVPTDTRLLLARPAGVGDDIPLSCEILAPILAFYTVDDFDDAVNLCIDLNYHGGLGHTASIFSNDDARIEEFAGIMNAGRIVVNCPSTQGAVGGTVTGLRPSLTLGCGSGGKNITTDNITARHLLNIQRVARRRPNERWQAFDTARYLDPGLTAVDIEHEYNKNH